MNLYHWNRCEFNRSYGRGDAIAYAPDLETAIQNILAKCREEYRERYYVEPEGEDEDFNEKMAETEAELRSTEPTINPKVILIDGSD